MPNPLKNLERLWRRHLRNPLRARWRGWRYRAMPIAMVTGSKGKSTTTRLVASILDEKGHTVGVATTNDARIGDEILRVGDVAGVTGAGFVLKDGRATAAALETARGGLIRDRLYLRPVTAAALLNVGNDHVGMDGVATVDDMARVKRRVVDAARHVVLNADDARCAALASRYRTRRVTLFSLDPASPQVAAHLAAGGRAVILDADRDLAILEPGHSPRKLMAAAVIPVTQGGRIGHFIADALAAAALGLALGADDEAIRRGLAAFAGGPAQNPARMNFFAGYPFTLMVDQALDPTVFAQVARHACDVAGEGPRLAVLSNVGNRTDDFLRGMGRAAGAIFPKLIVYEEEEMLRGRAPGEIAGLIAEGAREVGLEGEAVEILLDRDAAMTRAAQCAAPGGLVHIVAHTGDPVSLVEQAFGPPSA